MRKQGVQTFLILSLIFVIGLSIFYKTFSLALFGDEWQLLWMIKSEFIKQGKWVVIRSDFSPYQPGGMIIYLWTEILNNYSGKPIYITAFILRFLAAAALYIFLLRRGVNKLASFTGSLLFMITPVGIEVTDWAKNQVSYLTIVLMFICLDITLSLKNLKDVVRLSTIYLIALITNPIRVPGLFILVSLLSSIVYISNNYARKYIWMVPLILAGITFLVSKTVLEGGFTDASTYLLIDSFSLRNLNSFMISLGNGLVPDGKLQTIGSSIIFALILVWKKNLFVGLKRRIIMFSYVTGVVISLLISSNNALVTGYIFIIILAMIIFIEFYQKRYAQLYETAICLGVAVAFNITAFLKTPFINLSSDHRYLIFSALTLPIIASFALNSNFLKSNKTINRIVIGIVTILVFSYWYRTNLLVGSMYLKHNQLYSDKIWEQVVSYVKDKDSVHTRLAFQFVYSDPKSQAKAPSSLEFGFFYHFGTYFNIWDESLLPVVLSNKAEVVSAVTDGKSSAKNDGKNYIFEKDDVYIFRINNDRLERIDLNDYI